MTKLVLVSLPIGNVEDFTPRAKRFLEETRILVVEDTRSFKDFCRFINVDYTDKKIISWHDQGSEKQLERILEICQEEKQIIFASEAGSPIISDPAYPLVKAALEKGIEVLSVPGVSAPIVALELSGLAPIPFHFHGFPPRDKGKKRSFLEVLLARAGTHILFEGVSRVEDTLDVLASLGPKVDIVIARELTKQFQSIHRFKGEDWLEQKKFVTFKGEFVLLFNGHIQEKEVSPLKVRELAQNVLNTGGRKKELSKLLAALLDQGSKEIYDKLSL